MSELKQKAMKGVKWTTISMGTRSILQLLQLIIIARYLSAEDFGLVAIVMVVIGFSQLFMDMGISNAIIHKQDISHKQLSTLYWLNIFSGCVLTVLIFIISPYIASFYNNENLTPLIRILSISFLINGIGNQYRVLLRKELRFNKLAKIEIASTVISFLVAVIMAVTGYGAYSLVFGILITALISNILLLKDGIKNNKPSFIFDFINIKPFLTFGLYQMGQNSIVYFNNQFDVILIGKLLGMEAVGVYNLTKQLVMRPSQIVNPIVTSVTFPVMSKVQDDQLRLKSIYLKIINYLSSLNFPIYILMIALSSLVVPLLLGEKWSNAIELFQILSLYALIRSTTNPAGSLLLSKGRADIGFWWSVGEFVLMPISIFVSSKWGVVGVGIGLLIFQVIVLLPNWYFIVRKMCGARFKEYFETQMKPLFSTILSVFITYIILSEIELSKFLQIVFFILLFFVFYFLISYWLNKNFIDEIKNLFIKKVFK